MIHGQNTKAVMTVVPALVDDGSATTVAVDTNGFDYVQVYLCIGVTDVALTTLAVQSSSTTGGTYANVTGWIAATSTAISGSTSSFPTATDDSKIWLFEGSTLNCDRFIKVVATAGDATGMNMCILVLLSRHTDGPLATAAQRGCEEILRNT